MSLARAALAAPWLFVAAAVRQRYFPDHSRLLVGGEEEHHYSLKGGVNFSRVKVQEKRLYLPGIEEIASVLGELLNNTFDDVKVSAVECPDLTKPPYYLMSAGLSGNTKLIEVGGVPFLQPWDRRQKVYDLLELATHMGRESVYICGAAGGPWPYVGRNSEAAINVKIQDGKVKQGSQVVWVDPLSPYNTGKEYQMQKLPDTETRTALFGSYLVTDGNAGKVIKIVAKNRTGASSFSSTIREALEEHFKDQVVGLGGMFVMREGNATLHIMPNYGATPLDNHATKSEWVRYFEMKAPIVFVGTIINRDIGLDLRLEHFHGWSDHGDAGHYDHDTTPGKVHYEGYFVPAYSIMRVDRP